jgi:acetylornithine/succinyldiaminopimelate/putrescine aminotransferase
MVPIDGKIRRETNPKLETAKRLRELGVLAMAANPSSVIALAPALVITKDEIDEGISLVDEALCVADRFVEE